MAQVHSRTIARGAGQGHSQSHSQAQSSSRSSSRSNAHSSSESQSRSRHSETFQPLITTNISRGPNVVVENVSGSRNTTTRFEDIAIAVSFSMPIEKGSLWFEGVGP